MNKLDIDELKNVPSDLNRLKSKVDNLDVDKLKTVPTDLKRLNDAVVKDVIKNRNIMQINKF